MSLDVTFNELRKWDACESGYRKLAKTLGGTKAYGKDKPISLLTILDSNDVDDTLWVVAHMTLAPEQERDIRLLACDFAERVLPIFQKAQPDDERPANAIAVARRYANGEATNEERAAAWDAAWAAAWDAAWDAAGAAAGDAARAAAWDAAGAAAGDAARAAAWAAAGAAERKSQEELLRTLLNEWNQQEAAA